MVVKIGNGNGFSVEDGDFSILLDPSRASGLFAVSHAHSDHLPSRVLSSEGCIASPETRAFASARQNLDLPEATHPSVSLLNAGHMVGSSMVMVETSAGKILYTGDFNTKDRLFLKGALPAKCDILILDGTFAEPEFVFPSIEDIVKETRDFILDSKERALLYGYAYGKAQVLTRLANDLGYPVIAQAEVFRANSISQKFDHDLGESIPFGSEKAEKLIADKNSPAIVVAPVTASQTFFARKLGKAGFSSAVFTGWANRGWLSGADRSIPLSDHADYAGLLEFVKGCDPTEVIVAHSKKGCSLPKTLKGMGYSARLAEKGFLVRF